MKSSAARKRSRRWPIAKATRLLPLFGDLPPEQQDRALADLGCRKIILATNVAETSLTIEGVTAVIDSGQARQMQVSPATGLPRLELVPISQASAAQRAGRAGRTAPGICWRLWDESSQRGRPAAETSRSAPQRPGRAAARNYLRWANTTTSLGSIRRRQMPSPTRSAYSHCSARSTISEQITPLGRELARLPAHPRLGRTAARRRRTRRAARNVGRRRPALRTRSVPLGRFRPPRPARIRQLSAAAPTSSTAFCALQAFHATGRSSDPALELHPGGARNVLRSADQLYHVAEFALRGTS